MSGKSDISKKYSSAQDPDSEEDRERGWLLLTDPLIDSLIH